MAENGHEFQSVESRFGLAFGQPGFRLLAGRVKFAGVVRRLEARRYLGASR